MKKVHKIAIALLRSGMSGEAGPNDVVTTVTVSTGDGYVTKYKVWKYHGNEIAKVFTNGKVFVNWQGWFTPSTTQRIYELCDCLRLPRPHKEDGWIMLKV